MQYFREPAGEAGQACPSKFAAFARLCKGRRLEVCLWSDVYYKPFPIDYCSVDTVSQVGEAIGKLKQSIRILYPHEPEVRAVSLKGDALILITSPFWQADRR